MTIISGAPDHSLLYVSVATTPAELAYCQNLAPSATDMYNTWYRSSHSKDFPGQYPAYPNEINTWVLDSPTELRNTTNSISYLGLVSPRPARDYYFEADLSSNNQDDDYIGLVAAFYKDPSTGVESDLSFLINVQAGVPNPDGTYSWWHHLIYNLNQTDGWTMSSYNIRSTGSTVTSGPSTGEVGWINSGKIRVRYQRQGDLITFDCTDFYSGDTPGPWLPGARRVIDLASDPRLAKFRGISKYGVGAQSQIGSNWSNIKNTVGGGVIFYTPTQSIYRFNPDTSSWDVDTVTPVANVIKPMRFVFSEPTNKLFYANIDGSLTPMAVPATSSNLGQVIPAQGLTVDDQGHLALSGSYTGTWNVDGQGVFSGDVTATAFNHSSDERLKTNVRPIEQVRALVQQLEGCRFNWLSSGASDLGFIAQQVELVFPELVTTNVQGFKAVAYDKVSAILVEAFKSLDLETQELKDQVRSCIERLNKLEGTDDI